MDILWAIMYRGGLVTTADEIRRGELGILVHMIFSIVREKTPGCDISNPYDDVPSP
jgi:hypothetical protein